MEFFTYIILSGGESETRGRDEKGTKRGSERERPGVAALRGASGRRSGPGPDAPARPPPAPAATASPPSPSRPGPRPDLAGPGSPGRDCRSSPGDAEYVVVWVCRHRDASNVGAAPARSSPAASCRTATPSAASAAAIAHNFHGNVIHSPITQARATPRRSGCRSTSQPAS